MEEKKEFKMHELGASDACNKRRNFGLIVNSAKENSYKKAIVIQDVLKKIIFDGITESEAETEIRKGLEKLPYHEREREAHIRDAVREIYRYVDYEKGPLTATVPADIEVGANMIVKVTPTFIKAKAEMRFIFVSEGRKKAKDIQIDGSIEVIKVKTGKPKDIRKADTDIGLWSMILYGRKFVRPGQKVVIKASYYYLRRIKRFRCSGGALFFCARMHSTHGRVTVSILDFHITSEYSLKILRLSTKDVFLMLHISALQIVFYLCSANFGRTFKVDNSSPLIL